MCNREQIQVTPLQYPPIMKRLLQTAALSALLLAPASATQAQISFGIHIGEPPAPVRSLIETTRLAMMAGIAAAQPGNHIGDIGAAVEDVARPMGYGVIRQFVGHGIGRAMHEDPQVPNYRTGQAGRRIEPGLCLAIEPMFTLGSYEAMMLPDDWTIVTRDGSLAAHFEHSITITEHGPEILTTV